MGYAKTFTKESVLVLKSLVLPGSIQSHSGGRDLSGCNIIHVSDEAPFGTLCME